MWVSDMRKTIEKMLRRYGTQLTVYSDGGEESFRGFLHFITSRSWQNSQRDMTVLGEDPGGLYVLITPTSVQVNPGDTVEEGVWQYTVRRVEQVMYRDEILYQWGLCVKKGGE